MRIRVFGSAFSDAQAPKHLEISKANPNRPLDKANMHFYEIISAETEWIGDIGFSIPGEFATPECGDSNISPRIQRGSNFSQKS